MKKIIGFFITCLVLSCSSKSSQNFILKGEVKGLKKGTIYLEKIKNETITVVDSIFINNGTETFTFHQHIDQTEMYILSLDKMNTKQILFLGEPGEIFIKTDLNKFIKNAKITGSALNNLRKKYKEYAKKITDKNLDLIKEKFEAKRSNDLLKLKKIEEKRLYNLKRLYLFSANYAITHKNSVIAPYIAVTKMQQATPKLKQQIYDALSTEVKQSNYGKQLKESLN